MFLEALVVNQERIFVNSFLEKMEVPILLFIFGVTSCLGNAIPETRLQKQYGVILDAGSSSTKVRVYEIQRKSFRTGVPDINEIFYKKVKPGISEFENSYQSIPNYIVGILEVLREILPEEAHATTPVYFMATAGLRLLEEEVTRTIMASVESVMSMKEVNPFLYRPGFVHILSGEEEALYAWLSANYLTGFLKNERPDDMGLVEIGGGSLQIAFIPEDPIYAGKMTVDVEGRDLSVYGHSFLSYGASLMEERVESYLMAENPHATVIINPCMLKGDVANATIAGKSVGMIGGGNASLCEEILKFYLKPVDEYMCSPKPCSIGQVYQPPIKKNHFITFGLVYVIATSMGVLSGSGHLNLTALRSTAHVYCSKPLAQVVIEGTDPMWASANCKDALYIPLVFSSLGFPEDTKSLFVKKEINGTRIAWSLGAMLYEGEKNNFYETSSVDPFVSNVHK